MGEMTHQERLRWFLKHESSLGVFGEGCDVEAVRVAIRHFAYQPIPRPSPATLEIARELMGDSDTKIAIVEGYSHALVIARELLRLGGKESE